MIRIDLVIEPLIHVGVSTTLYRSGTPTLSLAAVPHILNLSVQGVKASAFQAALDDAGICASVKSACSVEGTPSRGVFAVSRNRKNALSSWRISLSHLTTEEEISQFLKAFDTCYKELTK